MADDQDKDGGGAKDQPTPNIALAAKASPATVDGNVQPGMGKPIFLPSEEVQRAGWYEPRAGELIALYPERYKPVTGKG